MWYWHVTDTDLLPTIMAEGLIAPVYVCKSIGRCIDIREQQVEENLKSGSHSVLRIWWPKAVTVDEDTDYDAFIISENVPPNKIKIEY